MSASFFFYDLETTGIKSREGRIMQFAGQRTDMDLNPIGDSENIFVKLTPDVLPDPEAVLLTGITPQQTILDGITEFEFLKYFEKEIVIPETIFVGYNTVRFDDEFMRFLHYRNFYDPYAWQYIDNCSRWDLLDLVRITRALRPENIEWPFNEKNKPSNKLEQITKLNNLGHDNAHDALSDVNASISVAKLIKSNQPKLFEAMLEIHTKNAVKAFITANKTFVYTSGKYPDATQKTCVVECIDMGDDSKGALVYDLRRDPSEFMGMSPEELVERWQSTKDAKAPARLPVKAMKYNRCPAVAKIGIIADLGVQERLNITPEIVEKNRKKLRSNPGLIENILTARILLDDERAEQWSREVPDVDEALYSGEFFDDYDKKMMSAVRVADPSELGAIATNFHDIRLREMLPRYKPRNFPGSLTDEERQAWEEYRTQKLFAGGNDSRLAKYFDRLKTCAADPKYADKQFLLEELQLYGQSIMPAEL